jgi:hypothetical protein
MDVSGIPEAGPMLFVFAGVEERIRKIRQYAERAEHYVTADWEARGLPFAGEDPDRLLVIPCAAEPIPGQPDPWVKVVYQVQTNGRLKQRVLTLSVENRPGRMPHPQLMERVMGLFDMAGERYQIDPESLTGPASEAVPVYMAATQPEPLSARVWLWLET